MRATWAVLLLLPYILVAAVWGDYDYVRATYRACSRVTRMLEGQHDMHLCGKGGAFYSSVERVEFVFQVLHPLTKAEAREVLVDCVEKIQRTVNCSSKVRNYLSEYPFSSDNVEVALLICDYGHNMVCGPFPCAASSYCGSICYSYKEMGTEVGYSRSEKESYEQALGIVRGDG